MQETKEFFTIVTSSSSSSAVTIQYETLVVNLRQMNPYAIPSKRHISLLFKQEFSCQFKTLSLEHNEDKLYSSSDKATNPYDFWTEVYFITKQLQINFLKRNF